MLKIKNLHKSFSKDSYPLQGLSLSLKSGEVIALMGPSGSGKSTLLNIIAGIESFDSGSIYLDDKEIDYENKQRVEKLRKSDIGIIFQQFLLLDNLSVKEQLSLTTDASNELILKYIDELGLSKQIDQKIEECSGGQQQRVSIARALVKQSKLLLADEPTANLDASLAIKSLELMIQIAKQNNTAVLIVTHDNRITPLCDRIVHIREGKVSNHENS